MQEKRKQSFRIYLLYLMGIMLFTDKSATYVDVTYLRYFRDFKSVSDYAWGAASLAHLYMELNYASHYKTKHDTYLCCRCFITSRVWESGMHEVDI
uniref:Aminotransferase-like plant mobile domain-containing protein n=1 Tax=Medicago truncatula TaxID=3880 RepID=A2Q3N4_MEDTR|nr:hypothetical protein MtrDRAFT_AC155886g12v2 [Medicago truncatula]